MTVPQFVGEISVNENGHLSLYSVERRVTACSLRQVEPRSGQDQGAVQRTKLYVVFDDISHHIQGVWEKFLILEPCCPWRCKQRDITRVKTGNCMSARKWRCLSLNITLVNETYMVSGKTSEHAFWNEFVKVPAARCWLTKVSLCLLAMRIALKIGNIVAIRIFLEIISIKHYWTIHMHRLQFWAMIHKQWENTD